MASKVQLTGGAFQDSKGTVLANGYLEFVLSQDCSVTGVGNIASGVKIKIQLDANGNAAITPALQYLWGNNVLLPQPNYYRVTGYTSDGQPAWGPNNQQVIGDGGTFDLGTWVPNKVISWGPPVQFPELEVNGIPNVIQTLLDLVNSSTIHFTDNGDGSVSASTTFPAPTPLQLEVNGTPNVVQTLLNLKNSPTVTFVDNGDGSVSASSSLSALGTGAKFLPGEFLANSFASGGISPAAANETFFWLTQIYAPITISKISLEATGAVSGRGTFGLYTANGATKIFDAGANAFDMDSLTTPGVQTVSVTPVTIQPGVYLAVFSATINTPTVSYTHTITSGSGAGFIGLLTAVGTPVGIGANALSAGALPASLGVLTAKPTYTTFPGIILSN